MQAHNRIEIKSFPELVPRWWLRMFTDGICGCPLPRAVEIDGKDYDFSVIPADGVTRAAGGVLIPGATLPTIAKAKPNQDSLQKMLDATRGPKLVTMPRAQLLTLCYTDRVCLGCGGDGIGAGEDLPVCPECLGTGKPSRRPLKFFGQYLDAALVFNTISRLPNGNRVEVHRHSKDATAFVGKAGTVEDWIFVLASLDPQTADRVVQEFPEEKTETQ